MRGRSLALLFLSAVVAVALAGCSAAASDVGSPPKGAPVVSTQPATPTPSPIPSPIPTPTLSASDPASWTIDFDGVGPAKLGAQLSVDRAALSQLTDQSEPPCPIAIFGRQSSPTIILVPNASDTVYTIDVMGLLWGNANHSETPRTTAGIGADSTLTELLAAYPSIQKTGAYSFLDYYGITNGSGHWIVFAVDTDTGAVWGIQVGSARGMPSELCG